MDHFQETLRISDAFKIEPETIIKWSRYLLIGVFCIVTIIQSGLRDINELSDENDTVVYQELYEDVKKNPWRTILADFSIYSTDYKERDSGYSVFVKMTQTVSDSFTFYKFLVASIFIIPFGLLIGKYVKSYLGVILSFLIFYSLFINIINSFMRQAITMGVVLFALRYVLQRDWFKYFALLLVSFTIHSSVIVASLFYFLPKLNNSRTWLLFALVVSPLLLVFVNFIVSFFVVGSVYEVYADSEKLTPISYIILVYFVSLFTYFLFDNLKSIDGHEILISGVIGSLFFLPITFLGGAMIRLSYYFVITITVLIPALIDSIEMNKTQRVLAYFITLGFFLYHII